MKPTLPDSGHVDAPQRPGELLREVLAMQEAERLAAQLDWPRLAAACPPAKDWLEGDEPKPF